MSAEQLAREIAGEIKAAILGRSQSILASDLNIVCEEIADLIKPLVDKIRFHEEAIDTLRQLLGWSKIYESKHESETIHDLHPA